MQESTNSTFRTRQELWDRLRYRLTHLPEVISHLGPAFLVGLGGGIGAIIFRSLIDAVTHFSFTWLPDVTRNWGAAYLIIAPAVGGLLVGLLITFFAPEAKGHGVPEVMEAVALHGGAIRPIVVLIKSLASSLSIGSGGSVGREGPIVQIGAALGSTIGQKLHFSEERIRNLVGCGAAAGIAATFNAPIAGFIFAMEVILGDFGVQNFSSVAIASVTSAVIGRIAFGDVPAFGVPEYALQTLWEYPLYIVLGIAAAVIGVAYVRSVYAAEDLFDNIKSIPAYIKPAIGGVLLGLLALLYLNLFPLEGTTVPHIYGVGYETIEQALLGKVTIGAALAFMLLKILSTGLTIGSGGSGGIFAPSLFIGATLGAATGAGLHLLFPGALGPVGAYALVGMGAVFAAAAHAPITAVLILFELTDDYRIILPLLLAAGIASVLSHQWMKGESIYTLKLSRRGVRLQFGRDTDLMETIQVRHVINSQPVTVNHAFKAKGLAELFLQTNRHAFPILDEARQMCGMVSLSDLRRVKDQENLSDLTVLDIGTASPIVAHLDDRMRTVLRKMASRDLSCLPVVDSGNPRELLGTVDRSDIITAYEKGLVERKITGSRMVSPPPGTELLRFTLTPSAAVSGQTLAEIPFHHDCTVISIQRKGATVIPHGDTHLLPSDEVIMLCGTDQADDLKDIMGIAPDQED